MAQPGPKPKSGRTAFDKGDQEALAAYREMAQDEEREAEAHAWDEATVGDLAEDDDLEPESDFSEAVRGKYCERCQQRT